MTAAARKPADRAWIRAYGFSALDTGALTGRLGCFGVVFNTVPAPLLDRALLSELPAGALVVDLASAPGGDRSAAGDLGLDWVWPGLCPAVWCPPPGGGHFGRGGFHIKRTR